METVIERHVYFKLKDRADRDRVAEAALRELPRVPGVRGVRVGRPADAGAEVWDVALTVTFASLDDLAAYLDHPTHRAFVTAVLEPTVEVRKAWNFSVVAGRSG